MSNKIGANELCPCGNGKKYKRCYQLKSEECNFYVQQNGKEISAKYDKIALEVANSLVHTTQDLNSLFYKTPEDKEVIPPLMQMIGIFTIIDVFGSYWYEYIQKHGSQSERFDDYIKSFCFTDKNKEFVGKKYLAGITVEDLRKLRNSIVHFYGFGLNHGFCIIANPSKTSTQEQIDLTVKGFLKIKKDLIFIQPLELKKIIIEGAMVMLAQFQAEGVSAKTNNEVLVWFHNIERIHQKLQQEGAKIMSQPMAQKITDKLFPQK